MFRRTMIIVISVLAVIFLALLLRRLQSLDYGPQDELYKVKPKEVIGDSAGGMPVDQSGTEVSDSDFQVIIRDPETNRLVQDIRAEKMAPEVGTSRTHLTRPDFFIYNDRGEQLYITAPRGYFDTAGSLVDGYESIIRGELSGGVVIRMDRSTPRDPSDDIVMTMDHLQYNRNATIENPQPVADNNLGPVSKLYTDDPVKVRSPEGDVDALGMIIYLLRGKSELKELRLLKDVHIVLRTEGDEFEVGLTSGGNSATGTPATSDEPAAAPAREAEKKKTGPRQNGKAARAAPPMVEVRRETPEIPATPAIEEPRAAATEKTAQAAPADVTQSLYHFYLKGNVRVRQGDRGLDADEMTLLTKENNPVQSGRDKPERPGARAGQTRSAPPGAAAAAGRPGRPPGQPLKPKPTAAGSRSHPTVPPQKRPAATTQAATTGPSTTQATQAAQAIPATEDAPPKEALPVDIVCDGPFILTPQVHSGPPVKFRMTAKGEKVVLTDKDMTASGQFFSYDGSLEQGVLKADSGQTAKVVQGENVIVGPHITFDQLKGTARVDGRGTLVAGGAGQGFGGGSEKKARGGESPLNARWNDWMEIGFVTREVISDKDPEKTESKRFLRLARFTGQAVLRQDEQTLAGDRIRIDFYLPTARGDFGLRKVTADGRVAVSQPGGGGGSEALALGDLVCEHLEFDFLRLPNGKSRPDLLFAEGQVKGGGKDSKGQVGQIEAEKLWVKFSPDPEDPEKGKPSDMTARGDVRVRRKGLQAEADYLKTDQGGDTILLVGTATKWAMAGSGPNKLRGQRILIAQETRGKKKVPRRADVTGPGTLDLMSSRGLDGQKLGERTPLHIEWTESMFFDGRKNQAHFAGRTRTRTPSASIDCRDLWVFFLDAEPGPQAAARAPNDSDDQDGLFDKKDLSRLTAIEKVVARTIERPDNPAKGLQVATLRCEKLEYNAVRDKAYVPGPGRLKIIEVRRRPVAMPPHQRPPVNSTEVIWKKEMIFERSRQVAYFGEDVVTTIVGRSKGAIAEDEGSGQFSDLSVLKCQDLRLFFVEKEARNLDDAGRRKGMKLKRLVATDRVFFKDGDYHARGGRAVYDQQKDLLVLTRTQGRPAAIWVQNEKKELFNRWGGDKLFYWRQTRRIKTIGQRDITITPREKSIFDR
ncbi:MAG: hypothetical protein GWP05_05945 [Anaerolineaceae bacterium]|nr:hypothetical protein [Anaerolineaceae bacterium]